MSTQVQNIGKFLAHELLHDPRVAAAATTLVADVIRRPSTREAFLDLVVWTVDRDQTKAAVRDALRAVVADLCRDGHTQERAGELIAAALRTGDTRDAVPGGARVLGARRGASDFEHWRQIIAAFSAALPRRASRGSLRF